MSQGSFKRDSIEPKFLSIRTGVWSYLAASLYLAEDVFRLYAMLANYNKIEGV